MDNDPAPIIYGIEQNMWRGSDLILGEYIIFRGVGHPMVQIQAAKILVFPLFCPAGLQLMTRLQNRRDKCTKYF